MVTINAINYLSLSNPTALTSWKKLYDAAKLAEQTDDEVHISLVGIQNLTPNEFIDTLILDPKIVFDITSGTATLKAIHGSALILLHNNKNSLLQKINVIDNAAKKAPTKKQMAQQARNDMYRNNIKAELAKHTGTEIFCKMTDLVQGTKLTNMKTAFDDIQMFLSILTEELEAHNIKSVYISMKNIQYYAGMLYQYLADAIKACLSKNIKMTFTDCSDALNDKLRIYLKITTSNSSIDKLRSCLTSLDTGRVVLLTKLKEHDTENMTYRKDDEVVAQYIAILRGVEDDIAHFEYTGFDRLRSYQDQYMKYGNVELCEKPVMLKLDIPIKELGFTDVRIARLWHLNVFDGSVKGSSQFDFIETHTGNKISTINPPELVVLPEYLRRSLKSWGIPFNEFKLKEDIAGFSRTHKIKK